MKYSIKNRRKEKRKCFTAKRICNRRSEFINFSSLFEEHSELLPVLRKKSFFFSRFISFIKKIISKLFAWLKKKADAKRERRKRRPETLFMLLGATCASVLVLLLSVSIVLFSFFGRYASPYTTVTVPSLVGTLYDENSDETNKYFSFVVDYEYNPNVPAGYVISQTPPANTLRRVYEKRGRCLISLTVSHAKSAYFLEDLSGLSERDASLILKNNGLLPEIKKEYSDTLPFGTVIRTEPQANKKMNDGERVTLTVSLGTQTIFCSVPNVCGLTETQAVIKLKSAGLICGQTTYSYSELPAGTVIKQSINANSAVKENTSVDITVSVGLKEIKGIPDLYGLTESEARDTLRKYGLVLGAVTPVISAEKKGTVIAQSPAKDTPITSSTVAVNVFVSY